MGILRLLLALSVVSVHADTILGCRFVGGQIAVQAFYIISGFYMALILNEKYIGKNGSNKLFITNRFLRLYPIYLAILVLTLMACLAVFVQTGGHSFPKFESYENINFNAKSLTFLIFTNLFIIGQDIVLFLGIVPSDGHLFFTSHFYQTNPHVYSLMFVPQAWSLSIEIMFYMIAPFMLRRNIKIQISILLLSFLLRCYLYNILNFKDDPWTYRFFPTELFFFLLGSLTYRMKNKFFHTKISRANCTLLLGFLILFSITYFHLPDCKIQIMPFSVKEILYFSSIVLSIPVLFTYFSNSKWDTAIGDLSYPVYISHKLIIMILSGLPVIFLRNGVTVAIVSIILSILMNKYVSAPIDRMRQLRLKR